MRSHSKTANEWGTPPRSPKFFYVRPASGTRVTDSIQLDSHSLQRQLPRSRFGMWQAVIAECAHAQLVDRLVGPPTLGTRLANVVLWLRFPHGGSLRPPASAGFHNPAVNFKMLRRPDRSTRLCSFHYVPKTWFSLVRWNRSFTRGDRLTNSSAQYAAAATETFSPTSVPRPELSR